MKKVYWLAARNYQSVRYAYVWCEKLASWGPSMGRDIYNYIPDRLVMRQLYRDYRADAEHLGDVTVKFQLPDGIIRPVHFDTWYEIFCRVYDKY